VVLPEPEVVLPEPEVVLPEPDEQQIREAAALLLDSLKRSRQIRADALGVFYAASKPPAAAISDILGSLDSAAAEYSERLARALSRMPPSR